MNAKSSIEYGLCALRTHLVLSPMQPSDHEVIRCEDFRADGFPPSALSLFLPDSSRRADERSTAPAPYRCLSQDLFYVNRHNKACSSPPSQVVIFVEILQKQTRGKEATPSSLGSFAETGMPLRIGQSVRKIAGQIALFFN